MMQKVVTISFFFKAVLLLFFVSIEIDSIAQPADTTLVPETFSKNDIIPYRPQREQRVYAAGKILEDIQEIPQTIYIITREEIATYGYSTLVDILKNIPGFRVSQPGSAMFGETFLSRGLVGNTYTSILINGQPVKPSGVAGMPIGSQLPIRQAERIEIIMGSSSTLYGSNAMSGVINIVLPEINRPVEVSSDLRIGSFGLTEINTSLGGKVGKNKNVFVYNLYGSAKSIQNYGLETSQFTVSQEVADNIDFKSSAEDSLRPEIRDIPHESSLIGGSFSFRDFTVTGNIMKRKDHAALGAFPGIISYSDQGNYLAESIYHAGLQFNRKLNESLTAVVNSSFVFYETDNGSSYTGITHDLANGRNYIYATSSDFRIEPLLQYSKGKFNVLLGAQGVYSSGINFQNYLLSPFDLNQLDSDSLGNTIVSNSKDPTSLIDSISILDAYSFGSYSVFSQFFYKTQKLNILLGCRYEQQPDIDGVFNPNIGIVYKLNKRLNARMSYANAFQIPSQFFQSNNYSSIPVNNGTQTPIQQPYVRRPIILNPEKLRNFELAVNYKLSEDGKHYISFQSFRHQLINSLLTEIKVLYDTTAPPPMDGYFVGYSNRNTVSKLMGFQLSYFGQKGVFRYDLHAQYYIGSEEIEDLTEISSYRSVPNVAFNLNLKAHITAKTIIGLNVRYDGPFVNRVVLDRGNLLEEATGGSYNIDFFINHQFGKNINATIKVINLTNTITKGVFTNWLDGYEFDYVPQLNRWGFINLSYRLN